MVKITVSNLEDMREKRPVLGKTAYKIRVKKLFRSQKAQTMAKQFAGKLRSTRSQVIKNNGAAARN